MTKVRDRFGELQAALSLSKTESSKSEIDVTASTSKIEQWVSRFDEEIDKVWHDLRVLNEALKVIEAQQKENLVRGTDTGTLLQLDQEFRKNLKAVSRTIKGLDNEIVEKVAILPAPVIRTQRLKWSQTSKEFLRILQNSNDAELAFSEKNKTLLQQKLAAAGRKASDREVYEMVDKKQTDVFSANYTQQSRETREALMDAEVRYNQLLAVEDSLKQLHDLMEEMQLLVEHQGEKVDNIEKTVDGAVVGVDTGKENLTRAKKYKKKYKLKKMWISIVVGSVVLVVIGVVVILLLVVFN